MRQGQYRRRQPARRTKSADREVAAKTGHVGESIMAQLKPLSEQAKSDAEIASFEQLNEGVQSIMEAATKLPPEVEKKAKKN